MIETVVFDFDGTLVDSNAIKRQGFFAVVANHPGGDALMRRVLAEVDGDRRAIFDAYVALQGEADSSRRYDAGALTLEYSAHVDSAVASAAEMPGATALLQELRLHGKHLYLSSATPLSSLQRIVERRGWSQLFDAIFGAPDDKRSSLSRICAATTAAPSAIAVIGDGPDDRESAAALGCAFFAVGEARGRLPHEPVFTLPELLGKLLRKAQRVQP
jgi:phosphoglycolate phosphatase-like HAD superfamily hydrolase